MSFTYEAFAAVVLAFLFDNTMGKKDFQIRKYIVLNQGVQDEIDEVRVDWKVACLTICIKFLQQLNSK